MSAEFAEAQREGLAIMWDAIRDRSAIACMNAPDPPSIPKGRQHYIYEVGQTVYFTSLGLYKEGTPVTIVDRYTQHGYCYYVDAAGKAHREKDLKPAP